MRFAGRVKIIELSGIRKIFEAAGPGSINLGLGQPDFDTPAHIKDAAIRAICEGKTGYTPGTGIPELRAAITRKLKTENNLSYTSDQVLVTAGASEALHIVMQALVERGEKVLCPDPGFVSYASLAGIAEGVPVSVPLDKNLRIDVERAKTLMDGARLFILNSPANPTGAVESKESIKAIVEYADDKGVTVVSDEVYEHFIYGKKHWSAARSTVLLQGESGTGKEVIAKAVHLNSPRRDKPFVPVNTGSMPTDLLESTLFGHVKGAFTSAIASKKGLFEVADKGTLFLDEIATMGLETQAKILRVLQDRRFMHLGGIQEIQVDVRIIAATNIDLRQMVREGRFREDLFYRLNVITVELPPLRQRKEDIPLLVEFFLKKYAAENERAAPRITPEALRPLMAYSWPGNVRELENVIERAVVLSSGPEISMDLLPESMMGRGSSLTLHDAPSDSSLFEIVEDVERRVITDMLERCNWNQTEAAERFHVPLSTLNQKIRRLNIEIKKKGRG